MTDRDRARLAQVHPELAARMARVLAAVEAIGHPMTITAGLRTLEEQQRLYAQGRTMPGPVVTNCDGVRKPSNHQGGRAVDCAFMVDGQPSWDTRLPWTLYGEAVRVVGLVWGGAWKLRDLPHAELPKEVT